MAVDIGRRGSLGIFLESTAGTTGAISKWVPFLNVDLIERHEPIADLAAKGVRDMQGEDSIEGKKHGEGSISLALDTEHAQYLFALALGAEVTTAVSATITKHAFTRKANGVPLTATIVRKRTVDEIEFSMAAVDSLEMSFADDVAQVTANVLSRYPGPGDGGAASIDEVELFTFRQATLVMADLGTSTTSELKVTDFNLSINNNLETIYAPGSNDVDQIVAGQFEASGSFTVLFENTTQKNAFKDLTKQELIVEFLADGTGKITITIPKLRLSGLSIESPLDDPQEQSADFVAEYDGTNLISVAVENETLNKIIP